MVSNGTAVLGLGNIGPLASKPVMEGKAVLFKKFAGIDVFDIEIDAPDIERMVERHLGAGADLRRHQPRGHQGAGVLRGRAASCSETMNIPVFHDDQHGTAIIVARRDPERAGTRRQEAVEVKIVTSGAGAAALACLNLLVSLGAKVENIWVTDRLRPRLQGPRRRDGPLEGSLRQGHAKRVRWPTSSAARTSSSASPRPAC